LDVYLLLLHTQVMPVHAARMLPGSEQIATNMPQLMAAFDPAEPLTFQVRNQAAAAAAAHTLSATQNRWRQQQQQLMPDA
jgi:hypothetical protein